MDYSSNYFIDKKKTIEKFIQISKNDEKNKRFSEL